MLMAIFTMYKVTRSLISTVVITATIGVKQGSPTSCFMFILFVDVLIRNIKNNCRPDGFLSWLHVMLMNNTVIFCHVSSKADTEIIYAREFCDKYNMRVNEDMTKL